MKQRDKAHKTRPYDQERFKQLRSRASNALDSAKSQFIAQEISTATSAKQCWETLGMMKSKTPSALHFFSATELNDHFSAIVDRYPALSPIDLDELVNLPPVQPLNQQFAFRAVTMLDINKALRKTCSTSFGHDNITLPMVKKCIATLGPYIFALINKSVSTGTDPSSWKLAHISRLSKTSHPISPNDARPVGLLPELSKFAKRIVQQQLMEFIQANKLLTNRATKRAIACKQP